ncbi:MAG: hypothetical protein OXJ90_15005 [Spirochaetaceae bacterium]|nr:hypothetical protein [Spirochaetaceae bacterium]
MGFQLNRIRILRRGTVRQVAAVAVLAAVGCSRTDVPAETSETVDSYTIAALADGLATGFSGPDVSVEASSDTVAAAASGPDSRGFFYIHSWGCCGGEEEAYLFKRGGWEYAVSSGYSRNVNPDIAAEQGDYSERHLISVTSPDGESFTIR